MRSLPALLAAAALCLFSAPASAVLSPRTAHTSSLLPTGDVLIVGGIDNTGTFLLSSDLKRTSKDGSVIAGPGFNVARASHTATVLGNGCVVVAGGVNGGGATGDVEVYDPATNAVINRYPAGITPRYNHTATLLNDGRVLMCGGQTTGGGVITPGTCDIFTPTGVTGAGNCGGTFSLGAATMLHQRTLNTATLLQDGSVWFAGGWDGAAFTPTTERYSPKAPAGFNSASPMIQARSNHTATMMGDGRIFVSGGFDSQNVLENQGILDTTEIYDPVANNTIPGPTLEARRHMHTSVLQADGSVMLFGGLGNITTTYITPGLVFGVPSIINAPGGVISAGASIPNVALNFQLGVPVVGTFNNASVLLSQPTAVFTWGSATFNDPLDESLAGASATCNTAGCGFVNIPVLSMPNIGGTATFTPVTAALTATATGGTLHTTGANLSGADDAVFSPSFVVPGMGGAVVTGSITGLAGTLTSQSYTVTITNGSINVAGITVAADNDLTLPGADVTGMTGTIAFNTISGLNATNEVITAGNLYFTPASLDGIANTSASLNTTGPLSDVTFGMVLNLPPDLIGATVTGTLAIQSGTIAQTSGGPTTNKYTVSLSGGSIPFSGTVDALAQLTLPSVTASSLAGTVTWSSGTVNSGIDATGGLLTVAGNATITATNLTPDGVVALSGTFNYTATNITIGFASPATPIALSVHTSTVVVNSMVFGQAEYYNPAANSVSLSGFGNASPSIETFNQTATLLPTNDVMLTGGSDCAGGAGCPNLAARVDAPLLGQYRDTSYFHYDTNFSGTGGGLKTPRALHTATLLTDGTILIAGGTNGLNLLSSAEIFNTNTEQYVTTPGTMSNPRDLHTATLLSNGRVLIAGGVSTNATSTGSISSTDIYYPDTQLFIPTTPMANARSNHTATLMPDGTVVVVGGFGTNNVITGTAEKFDPEHLTWTSLATTSPRTLHTATLLKDGRLMVAGGVDPSGVLNTVCAYTPGGAGGVGCGGGPWNALASMPVHLRSHTATLLFDGRVLVAGGDDGNGETTSSYIYDPVANSWTPASAPPTSPLGYGRLGHTATLLPDGAVMISGGTTKYGAIPTAIELYHVDGSTWVSGNQFLLGPRANHTMTLAPNGYVYAIGGSNGVIGGQGTSLWGPGEKGYFSSVPDLVSKNAPPSLRQSTFTITSPSPLQPSESFALTGSKFLGGTEGSGGGSASANSSFDTPHLILQKTDSSDFVADLTTAALAGGTAPTNSALSATLPATQALLPWGWYNARLGDNALYSNGTFIQVGPALPGAVTNLAGAAQGVSSITWNWTAVAGVDGYNVYQASSSVFIATCAANSFIQTGLPSNSAQQIRVAGYTTSGDGPSATSPITAVAPITTITSVICGANNSGDTTTSIPWSWTAVPSASYYNVYNSTSGSGIPIYTPTQPNVEDIGLGINTQRVITVAAVTAGIQGALTSPTTCYTLAAQPQPPLPSQNLPLMTSTEPTSVSLNWIPNGNPAGTIYQAIFTSYVSTSSPQTAISSTALSAYLPGLTPSNYYSAQIVALNGANVASVPLIAGTTFTLPAAPTPVTIQGTTPVTISAAWNGAINSTMTYYQIVYSTDAGFTGTISTAVPFAARYSGSTYTLTSLLTGTSYWISVQAENPFGQTSTAFILSTVTYNGGAPTGSLGGVLTALGGSEISGTIGNVMAPRYVDIRSPSGAFPSDTAVVISTYSLLDHGALCPSGVTGAGGAGIVLSIVDNPALQPSHPVYLSAGYTTTEAASFPAPTAQLALARFDPGSGTCVPLQTTFNSATQTFYAELNHFSLYQVVSVPLATTPGTARIYPNPYHAATDGYVTIDQVPPGSRVRIFTLRGERIMDVTANGAGNVTWYGDNAAGRPVASGLYIVEIEANGSKNILKLAVIR